MPERSINLAHIYFSIHNIVILIESFEEDFDKNWTITDFSTLHFYKICKKFCENACNKLQKFFNNNHYLITNICNCPLCYNVNILNLNLAFSCIQEAVEDTNNLIIPELLKENLSRLDILYLRRLKFCLNKISMDVSKISDMNKML